MAKLLYIDPFGGAAGDMLLGALLDLGVARERLQEVLGGLHLPGWRLDSERVSRHGFAGTRVTVHVEGGVHPHVTWPTSRSCWAGRSCRSACASGPWPPSDASSPPRRRCTA